MLYTAIITAVSLAPSSTFESLPAIPYADKIVHFFMYGIYAVLLVWTVRDQLFWARMPRYMTMLYVVLFCGLYGIAMEFLQHFFQPDERVFSLGDMAANFAGAFAFTLFVKKRLLSFLLEGTTNAANC